MAASGIAGLAGDRHGGRSGGSGHPGRRLRRPTRPARSHARSPSPTTRPGGRPRAPSTRTARTSDRSGCSFGGSAIRRVPDATTGPATIENVVWVAKDLASARAIYQEQVKMNKDFPEAFYARKGSFPFTISKIGEEVVRRERLPGLQREGGATPPPPGDVPARRGRLHALPVRRRSHDAAKPGDLVRDAGGRAGPRRGDEGAGARRRRAGRERRSRPRRQASRRPRRRSRW